MPNEDRTVLLLHPHTVRRYAGEYGRLFLYVLKSVDAEDITCTLQQVKFKHKYAIVQISYSLQPT
jgi:hypothetical protein